MTTIDLTVCITGMEGEAALHQASEFLARIFADRSVGEIRQALQSLPLILATHVSPAAAEVLKRHLTARGLEILLEPSPPRELPTQEGPLQAQAMELESVLTVEENTAEAAEGQTTSYTYARPGHKDHVFPR